ncbi:MAG: NlpC/P60 family protein [Bacteroidetes bacterium]|nr:NlpC/P60 family protein [Bacteroidota bacterium]
MNFRIAFILLLLPFMVCAQPKKTKHKTKNKTQKQSIEQYYAANQLVPDSACSPHLYYQVYDWVGTRYKYAGKTKKGIDCSGFVGEMYRNVYCINLSGGSRDIWSTVQPIEKTDLQEGDILFFKIKKGQISHVGIYLGNNKFAHSSVQSGVIISDLDEDYYKKYFFKGGRIL